MGTREDIIRANPQIDIQIGNHSGYPGNLTKIPDLPRHLAAIVLHIFLVNAAGQVEALEVGGVWPWEVVIQAVKDNKPIR